MFKKAAILTRPPRRAGTRRSARRAQRTDKEVHTKLVLIRALRSHASGYVLCLHWFCPVESLSEASTPLAGFFNILPFDSMKRIP
jgi:hypothetical protein